MVVNYNYRYYSPELGRWLSREKLGEGGGWNLYMFAKNSPMLFWDYLGLDPKWYERHGAVDRFLTALTGADKVADGIIETARESDPTIPPVPEDREYEAITSPGKYAGFEIGAVIGAGFTQVECCDENKCKKRMLFTKYCVGGFAGVGFSVGVHNLKNKTCDRKYYEKWFLEVTYGSLSGDFGYNEDSWGSPGSLSGTVEGGLNVSIGSEQIFSAKWCYYVFDSEEIIGCCK